MRVVSTIRYENGDAITIKCTKQIGCSVVLIVRGKRMVPKPPSDPRNSPWYAGDFLLIRGSLDSRGFLIRYPVVCPDDQFDEAHARCFFERRFSGNRLVDEDRGVTFSYDSPQ